MPSFFYFLDAAVDFVEVLPDLVKFMFDWYPFELTQKTLLNL